MKRMEIIPEPVAVYDTGMKRLIGVFKTQSLGGEYLFGKAKKMRINIVLRSKSKNRTNLLGICIIVRNANKEQLLLLGDKEYLLMPEYFDRKEAASLERSGRKSFGGYDTPRLKTKPSSTKKSMIDELLLTGASNESILNQLDVSRQLVSTQRRELFGKLHAYTDQEILDECFKRGLVPRKDA